jgi:hypothetical protein
MRFYESLGCAVVRFNEGRRTRNPGGWPDLFVFCERKRIAWPHECKEIGEKQSDFQRTIQRYFENCGISYVIGGVSAARAHVEAIGLIAAS